MQNLVQTRRLGDQRRAVPFANYIFEQTLLVQRELFFARTCTAIPVFYPPRSGLSVPIGLLDDDRGWLTAGSTLCCFLMD